MPNPSTNLQVSAGDGMSVVISPGFSMVNGCLKLEESQKSLEVQAADANYDRIDTVVMRLDDNDNVRACELSIIQGTPATSPVRPELTQNESVWEIGLADLLVVKNSTAITNARITDTRYETARCGVISSISEFDTTTLYQQIQSDLEGFQNISQAEFDAWFQQIKDTLSGDVAGNLQNQIGTLSNLLTTSKSDIVSAINELYNRTPDMLETLEEIDANTESGKQVDALAIKQLNRNLGECILFTEGSGEDTKYFIQMGADSASKKQLGSGTSKLYSTTFAQPAQHGTRDVSITCPDFTNIIGIESISFGHAMLTLSKFTTSGNVITLTILCSTATSLGASYRTVTVNVLGE